MDMFIIAVLLILGLALFVVEVFLLPGITLAGIVSAICLIYAICHAFYTLGMVGGWITLLITAAGCALITIWFMRSKTVDKLSLKKTLDYNTDPLLHLNLQVGDKGTAITRLALIGNAKFNGQVIEVRSADGFIDEKTIVCIESIKNGVVLVHKAE